MATVEGESVPPPGWGEREFAGAAPAMSLPVAAVAQTPEDAAVRWRISAAIIDNILVYIIYLLLCLVLHWQVANLNHLLALVVVGVLYHFALESRDGQTVGKRQYGLRVVAVDGQPAGAKAIAMRSALRIIDQLPVWYLSGLVSMVRTGAARRQRIGDVAAGTKVVAVEGRSAERGTPRWMLPTATLAALAISIFAVYTIAQAGRQPLNSTQTAEWLAGCDRATGQMLDCQCFLNRLEADGYDTLDSLKGIAEQAQTERLTGQRGQARSELTADALACRR